ncbi:FtsZ-binding cell division protein ZapB [Desulfomicrobium macestii]|uniref:FtsZ-binding cell division protein ZapB n=1 Tax=Desulfomicrobium macestii TaxID=90731 RepID=A0ABR9H928_9BACT|nr:hypothetical protein [Desulfomicrobium macestii]MBE1427212.1 FtsZ-binding cell division protein ZapB [Desulfomicrobium macestii]MBU0599026.1 hypothetical protein [Patescibacteria group bacterium]
MVYSLTQAAQATGLTRQGILAAIKRGTISGSKNAQGQWEIDAAELHRVYPLATVDSSVNTLVGSSVTPDNTLSTQAINTLQQRLAVTEALLQEARGQVDELKADREAWKNEAQAWQNQTKALTAAPSLEPKKRSLLARLFLARD